MSGFLTDSFINDLQKNHGEHLVFLRAWDYDDTKKFNPIQVKFSDIDEFNEVKLPDGNLNENGRHSIFFHPNGDMDKHRTRANRKDSDAETIYCLYADFDLGYANKSHKPRKDFVLQPSAVVETYNGYHCYWYLKNPLPVSLYIERWSECMKFLAEFLGGDPKVVNISRILRLPGCNYWGKKQGETDEPFRVQVIEYDENLRYELEDFEKVALPIRSVKAEQYVPDTNEKKVSTGNLKSNYDDICQRVSAIEVLMDLDKRYTIQNGTVIVEDGQPTGGYRYWKQSNAIIDFTGKNRASGTSFSVAKRYKGSDYETFQYFSERWGIGETVKKNIEIKSSTSTVVEASKSSEEEDDIDLKFEKLVPTISTLSGKVDIAIGAMNIVISFDDKKIYKIAGDEKTEIVDASIRTVGYFQDIDGINCYIVEYEKSSGDMGIIYLSKLGKKGEFEKRLSEVGISYFGGAGKVEKALIAYIHSTTNKLEYLNQLGIYDEKMVVNKAGKYISENAQGKKFFCDISDIMPADRNTDEVFRIGNKIPDEQALHTIKSLGNVYKESIIYSLFTHYAMSFFAYSIRKDFSWLPSASLVGTTSAGKTYARRLVMKMMGMDECMEIKASTTEFSVLTLCKHYLPLSVGEYSNEEVRFDRDPMMKNNYDGTANTRGTQSQKLKIYPNNACFCVDGEVGTMTNSVITRQIAMRFNTVFKKGLATRSQMENMNYFFLSKINNIKKVKPLYYDVWRPFLSEHFAHISKAEKERILDNYALLCSFADAFGFIDIVKDGLLEQCQTQFDLLGDEMIDRIIKLIFNFAITNRVEVQIKNKMFIIELLVDTMRVNKKKYDDLFSNAQNVNYNFYNMKQSTYTGSDRLEIPLEYILKNSSLHYAFVSLMEHNTRYAPSLNGIDDDGPTILALKQFYQSLNLEEKQFYAMKLNSYKTIGMKKEVEI